MYRILITDDLSPQGLALLETAEDATFDIRKGLSEAELAERIPPYHGLIVRSSVRVTEKVLAQAENLRVVGRAGVGIDNIDLDAASLRGILVTNTPGANSMATAEHTMAMLLALCRHIPQACRSLAEGEWNRKKFTGVQLYKKTIGIIGLGRIGSRVAVRCRAFGMNVIACDPYIGLEAARDLHVTLVDLDELFARADFITLHTALTPETRGLVNAQTIARMKDGVYLVNCARGALIEEADVAAALQAGKIAGAALDVFTHEPLPPDSPLRGLPNVIFTPHLAASTVEAQRDVGTQVVSQVLGALRGDDIRNAVNMPLANPRIFQTMRPYLELAEKVGSLQTQLADGRIHRLEVELHGEPGEQVKLITVALLKGLLSPVLEGNVNYINAPHLARQRGLSVSQATGLPARNYPNLITCRALWEGGSRLIAATIFHTDEPRVVQVDHYRMDVRPEGRILVVDSLDVPGVIGRMGTILGRAGVNIASMRLGRTRPGGPVLTFIKIDSPAPPEAIAEMLQFEPIARVRQVVL